MFLFSADISFLVAAITSISVGTIPEIKVVFEKTGGKVTLDVSG